MADEVPMTLEGLESQLLNYKHEDIKKKMGIAANVLKQCEQARYFNIICHLTKSNLLTGVPKNTLEVISSMEQKCKKFDDWIRDERRKVQHGYHFAYRNLRTLLMNYYTKQLIIPINLSNDKTAHKQFCISLQIPGTKKSIIVEKPETVMERHRFLYTKMMHRDAESNIVYIGKINLFSYKGRFSYGEYINESKSRFLIAASPTLGYISYVYFCGSSQEYLLNWVKDTIEPALPKECVIIFQDNVLVDSPETINSHSSKELMVKWLESKGVVLQDAKMHRADLYKLIQRCKASNIGEFSRVEEILRARGHITLRKQKCNLYNNYFDPFWSFMMHELNAKTERRISKVYSYSDSVRETANIIAQNAPIEYWRHLEDVLIEKERQIYKEDLEMELVIDKLMTMAKNEGLPDDETQPKLDDYSKQLEEEHFFISDNLITYLNMSNESWRRPRRGTE